MRQRASCCSRPGSHWTSVLLSDVALRAAPRWAVFVRGRGQLDVTGAAESVEQRFGSLGKIAAIGAVAVEAPARDAGLISKVVMACNAVDRRVFFVGEIDG